LDQPIIDRHAAELAAGEYERAARVVPDALAEYTRTIGSNPINAANYQGHMDELKAARELTAGDGFYLRAQMGAADQRAPLLEQAKQAYLRARYLYQLLILRYYTDVRYLQAFIPRGYDRFHAADRMGFEDLSADQMNQIITAIDAAMAKANDPHSDDRQEYDRYLARIAQRTNGLP
jgi:hypothetical protein